MKQSSPDRRGVSTMQAALQSFLTESGIGARLRPSAVFEAWNRAAGDALAAHARPVRFRAGELCVEVDSAAHLHELKNFSGEGLRAAANARLAGANSANARPAGAGTANARTAKARTAPVGTAHAGTGREQISRIVFRLKR